MFCIRSDITDPYFNLAAEEYLLKESGQEYFLLYVNDPSVIIGKHQNAYAEINLDYIRENNIKIVRRISGGGTVWHDYGNLNFSFISNGSTGNLVNFRKYMQPVMNVLLELRLNAEFEGKNSITVNGLKVSGNAEHIYKNRVLHHGTILFNSDLQGMSEALKAGTLKYRDKAVKSVRSTTANLSEYLGGGISLQEFGEILMKQVMELNPGSELYNFSTRDFEKINILIKDKYSKWEWNFGYSPDYIFEWKTEISGCEISVYLQVKKGIITEVSLSGDIFHKSSGEKIESLLLNQKHNEKVISEILNKCDLKNLLKPADLKDLVKAFF